MKEIIEIQIAPYKEDTVIKDNIIEGRIYRDGVTEVYTFTCDNPDARFAEENHDAWKDYFCTAIAMSDRSWQIEQAFAHYGVKGKMKVTEIETEQARSEERSDSYSVILDIDTFVEFTVKAGSEEEAEERARSLFSEMSDKDIRERLGNIRHIESVYIDRR